MLVQTLILTLCFVSCSSSYLHGDERSSRHRMRNKIKEGRGHNPHHHTRKGGKEGKKTPGVLDPGHRIVDAAQIHPNER
jgi:hypothetical protein